MPDRAAKEAYQAALAEHLRLIAPALRRIDEKIARATASDEDPASLKRLNTMRTLLVSGLFDAEYYVEEHPEVRQTGLDPAEHYVTIGEAHNWRPNVLFVPQYYREQVAVGLPPDHNALDHYINEGERAGLLPNVHFDPHAYLADNPGISDFVDRPLFHFLRVGPAARLAAQALPATGLAIAFLACRDPSFPLMSYKKVLADQLGAQGGFAVYKKALRLPDSDHLRVKRVASLRQIVETRGGAFYETAPAGEPFVVEPPTVIGEGNHRPLKGVARSMFVACLIGARVRGHSAVIEVDDLALLDFQGEELARIDDELEIDPAVFHAPTNEAVSIIAPENDGSTIELAEGFALLGPWTREFGHWMWDYLPRYVAALASGALPPVPLIVDADLPKTHRQALELMRPEGIEIIELPPFVTARVRRLWCAPSLMYMPLHEKENERFKWDYLAAPPARLAAVIHEMARRVERACPPAGVGDRVFLARKPFRLHKLLNTDEVEKAARERGFSIVYPEDFDFAEQAALLRQAHFVLGPDGSAINFLSWFARPGTKLCNLAHDYTIGLPVLTGSLSAIGLDVTVITGSRVRFSPEHPDFADYTVDEGVFRRFLDHWLDDSTAASSRRAAG